ncbi:hypothetical protein DFJ73DRAFT_875031 [Zopfochytrium polystomum]|nr:hypothetical protein DFJ73DRAFT_875031 [Zopfochytrium polystomum]
MQPPWPPLDGPPPPPAQMLRAPGVGSDGQFAASPRDRGPPLDYPHHHPPQPPSSAGGRISPLSPRVPRDDDRLTNDGRDDVVPYDDRSQRIAGDRVRAADLERRPSGSTPGGRRDWNRGDPARPGLDRQPPPFRDPPFENNRGPPPLRGPPRDGPPGMSGLARSDSFRRREESAAGKVGERPRYEERSAPRRNRSPSPSESEARAQFSEVDDTRKLLLVCL